MSGYGRVAPAQAADEPIDRALQDQGEIVQEHHARLHASQDSRAAERAVPESGHGRRG